MKDFAQDWEEVAKTEDAHKAIATTHYQNEQYYNLSGIISIASLMSYIIRFYKESCAELTIAEIGCGTGRETKYLADCFKKVFAIDASPTMVEKAKTRILKENVDFKATDSGTIPLEDESVDIVYSFIVFQHCNFDTVKNYFKEAYRVLKPGGRFMFQLGLGEDKEPANYGDVGKRTEETLIKDLQLEGFEIESLGKSHFDLHICIKRSGN